MNKYPLVGGSILAVVLIVLASSVSASILPIKITSMNSDIVWDNGGTSPGSHLYSSQLDNIYPFVSQVACDFIFETKENITNVCWWGDFFAGDPNDPCDFNIYFYADDGTGNAPTGGGMEDPSSTALASYFLPQVSGLPLDPNGFYEYNVELNPCFKAQPNEKYWIAIQAFFPIPPQYGWAETYYIKLSPAVQGFPLVGTPFWTVIDPTDFAFYLVGGNNTPPPSKPDLDSSGQLSWTNIKPGTTVNGSFQVMNVGESDSLLNWTIASYPDWGTWTFTPSSGTNLTPQDGPLTVNVEVIAPPDKEKSFNGTVRVVNTDNTGDFCDIPVTLTTPFEEGIHGSSFFERFFTRFPHALPILHYVLGYVCK